jgi:hypothetical protein
MFDGHNLILIVGSPRSGTTWLQKLLAAHPLVQTGQESDIFDEYLGPQLRAWRRQSQPERFSTRGGIGLGCYFTEAEFMQNLRNYQDTLLMPLLGGLTGQQVFLEKTPGHALYLPEILELLPRVRIVHILRDGRDVAASLLAASRGWGKIWAPKNPGHAAWVWMKHVHAVRNAQPSIPKEQFYEVRYETLFEDAAGTLRSLVNFLGLPWNENDLLDAVERNQPNPDRQQNATAIPLGGEMAKRSGSYVKDAPGFIRKGYPGSWRQDLSLLDKFHV